MAREHWEKTRKRNPRTLANAIVDMAANFPGNSVPRRINTINSERARGNIKQKPSHETWKYRDQGAAKTDDPHFVP